MAASGRSLWVATATAGHIPRTGPLIRLSPDLRVITPPEVRDSLVLRRSRQVWSHGSTVWVATAAAGHPLVCFTDRGGTGRLATLAVPGWPIVLAATGDVVYVSMANGGEAEVTSGIRAYTIPATCR